jgi:hypothetical protein
VERAHRGAHRHPGRGGGEVVQRGAALALCDDLLQRRLHELKLARRQALDRLGHCGEPEHFEFSRAVSETRICELHLRAEVAEHSSGGLHRIGDVPINVDIAQRRAHRDPQSQHTVAQHAGVWAGDRW